MAKKLIVGNWKMNPATYREAETLALGVSKLCRKIKNVETVLCPPFVWLADLSHRIRGLSWGSQDVFWENPPAVGGAFTGEISPAMLKNSGAKYAIIGHSERRRWLGETDEMINKKVASALGAGLKVILCVGEPLSVRRRGLSAAKNFVRRQLLKDLKTSKNYKLKAKSLIVAYEPVWAIGTGRSDKPSETVEMARFIKNLLKAKVLYGGSVTSKNIANFVQYKEIDGALVGGASLRVEEFKKIVKISSKI